MTNQFLVMDLLEHAGTWILLPHASIPPECTHAGVHMNTYWSFSTGPACLDGTIAADHPDLQMLPRGTVGGFRNPGHQLLQW